MLVCALARLSVPPAEAACLFIPERPKLAHKLDWRFHSSFLPSMASNSLSWIGWMFLPNVRLSRTSLVLQLTRRPWYLSSLFWLTQWHLARNIHTPISLLPHNDQSRVSSPSPILSSVRPSPPSNPHLRHPLLPRLHSLRSVLQPSNDTHVL